MTCKSDVRGGIPSEAVARRLLLLALAVLASLAFGGSARAELSQLFPGVSYETSVQFTPHGPVAIHVVRGPRPVGLYRLRTVLSNEAVVREETLSSMQRRRAGEATMVGINGDFSRNVDGKPSGILVRDGTLVTPPNAERSSVGVGLDGTLDVRRVSFFGAWRGAGQSRKLNDFNDAPERNGIALFTPDWGGVTPHVPRSHAVVLSPFPAAVPDADLSAQVTWSGPGSRLSIAPGTAVLVARGDAAASLRAEAPVGTTVTLRLSLRPDWGVADAIGGGPVLVRDGKAVHTANEGFTTSQILPRHPRSAVGQLADGRILLVVVDGRRAGYSVGLTTFGMAQTMVRLGAVRAMQLDGGGSSTLAFDGAVLNRPSDGRERPVPTALMLEYTGTYVPPPAAPVVSPNGDGVDDLQGLAFKVVRPSEVTVTLTGPDGAVAYQETGPRVPGIHGVPFPPPAIVPTPSPEVDPVPEPPAPPPPPPSPPAEGRWVLSVAATDDQGLSSSATRRFAVNSTLGFLRVKPRLVLRRRGGSAVVRWKQARPARVTVTVATRDGVVVRRLRPGQVRPGEHAITWNGRRGSGKLVAGGRYVVRVAATNGLGRVDLERQLAVRRIARQKR
jgi:hypothetical protein